ncbi:hypothetical protein [Microbacterium sp. P04]|uniref:hypothetical protein n=1 Tax=Microbacterium sp. P04 TaxID=3366947 RepID=UPI003746D2B4
MSSSAIVSLSTAPPAGDDSIGVFVEISPIDTSCTVDCAVDQPPALPVTGGEPLSILLPVALLLAGVAAMIWSRRGRGDQARPPTTV